MSEDSTVANETTAELDEKAAEAEGYGGTPVSEEELAKVWEADPGTTSGDT